MGFFIYDQKVFYVNADQVTKEAKSGEYVPKGAFMIYGKKNFAENKVNLCVGVKDGQMMAGPCSAIEHNCPEFVTLEQGTEKASSVAKKIQKKLGGELDDIIRLLPGGMFKLK